MNERNHLVRMLGTLVLVVTLTARPSAGAYDRMIVFGDSLSDSGNLSLFLPGVLTALNYDAPHITNGPTTMPASAFSGVMVEYLNTRLGLPTLVPSTLGGNNYAWAFATTGVGALDPANLIVPGTAAQVTSYHVTHPVADTNSLFVLWGGANDLLEATTPAELATATSTALTNLQGQLTTLLNIGARNILWFNLPDLGLTPRAAMGGPLLQGALQATSLAFRAGWSSTLAQLQALYPESNLMGVDTYAFMHSLVDNPELYGLTNLTAAAQGLTGVNPDEYLYWDSVHPTTRTASLLADYTYAQLQIQAVPEPGGSLYLGLALLGVITHRVLAARRKRR